VRGNPANLRPWPKGVSGNPGGRVKKQPITAELERLLGEEAPNREGHTWAQVIAQALLEQASRGDVRAISELTNRLEGKPLQAVNVNGDPLHGLSERLERIRKRQLDALSLEEINQKIRQLEERLRCREPQNGNEPTRAIETQSAQALGSQPPDPE